MNDPFNTRSSLIISSRKVEFFDINKMEQSGIPGISRLPFSIKVLLEAVLRNEDGFEVTARDAQAVASWKPNDAARPEIPFKPARVVMQDFTGVPAIVDLAAMRSAMQRLGGDPKKINPLVPVDLVIDHSVQVDYFGDPTALAKNAEIEFDRNRERYEFLAWGAKAFQKFRVVPPATGIVHQVNLEFLSQVVLTEHRGDEMIAYPDTLVGTDSHTTMINALGIVGWGVGGIEAEAVMLGQSVYMLIPDVVGFRLYGELAEGVTATDLTLTVVQMLRKKGVVDKFVEFYGDGLSHITLPDRATIANMAPEYGATIGYFPVDEVTLDYLRGTGRPEELVQLVEAYTKAQGLFRTANALDPIFSDTLELDLGTVVPSVAGPKRPQDKVALRDIKKSFTSLLTTSKAERGFELQPEAIGKTAVLEVESASAIVSHGAVVIAAITSCTNTSNPSVMIGAGLLAKKAVEKGLSVKSYIKTSMAPGSRVVTEYLNASGVMPYLDQLGFNVVGYGCTTCIGNSGPLPESVTKAVKEDGMVVASVLSGNRNFEGRVHPLTLANYLASPPLVVAFALAGTVDIDFEYEPLGVGSDGYPVYLRDIWPSQKEIADTVARSVKPEMFTKRYGNVFDGNVKWNAIAGTGGDLFDWKDDSTYIQEPPFFKDMPEQSQDIASIKGARTLGLYGDSVTTDHISPAGAIPENSPAGQYLISKGVMKKDFNSYGARRGNDKVMARGTFGNIRLQNQLMPGTEGGVTMYFGEYGNEQMSLYDAAMKYRERGVPLIVLAGAEYGAGSSRDWAAKGPFLLGVKAVIATSFERIHRSNLIGMGILPLQFKDGGSWKVLGLTGTEAFDIDIPEDLQPRQEIIVRAAFDDGSVKVFSTLCRIDTPVEVDYYRNGGILQTVLRRLLKK